MADPVERLLQSMQAQTAALVTQLQQQSDTNMRVQTEALAEAMNRLNLASKGSGASLVDSRGVGKPDVLNSKVANELSAFKTWRLKFVNWICASWPGAATILEELESSSSDEVTLVSYQKLVQEQPLVEQLSAQLRATLMSLCVEEPLSIVQNTTKGPQSGLEALRRLKRSLRPVGTQNGQGNAAKDDDDICCQGPGVAHGAREIGKRLRRL